MNYTRPLIFRDALQVPRERVAALSDTDLDLLMLDLIKAEAYRCGSPVSEVRVNTEGKAKDDGCDSWSGQPAAENGWLDEAATRRKICPTRIKI